MRDYRNIKAFQHADRLVLEIYQLTKYFPKEKTYGLVSQIRRASVSVPTNIVEGSKRKHAKEYLNFLYLSKSSLAEVEYLLDLPRKLDFIKETEYKKTDSIVQETSKTLYGLINTIEKNLSGL
ncbi:MAG: four helix bundle protein [Endomicrobiales bacterium]|nr:four helix bundle protein [Endomicrobiales bacterium]